MHWWELLLLQPSCGECMIPLPIGELDADNQESHLRGGGWERVRMGPGVPRGSTRKGRGRVRAGPHVRRWKGLSSRGGGKQLPLLTFNLMLILRSLDDMPAWQTVRHACSNNET